MAYKQLRTWSKRLIVALGLLSLAVSLSSAAATFGPITGPSCTLSACTFTAEVTAMSNPDKLVCLEYATFDFKNRCNDGNSGGDKTTTVGCACASPACDPTTGVGAWTCSGPPPGTSAIYWAITTWTSGSGGGTCGGEATFGACGTISPLAVTLAAFTAEATPAGVTLAWETVSETDNAGFNVYRGETEAGPWLKLNDALIPAVAPGSSEGHAYTWTDTTAEPGATYWYMLEDVALDGTATQHPPVQVTIAEPNAVGLAGPFVVTAALAARPGQAAVTPFVVTALAVLLALAALAGAGLRRRG